MRLPKMVNLISRLYHNRLLSRIFHTLLYCLQRELKNCKTVLDLGCGPSSPIQYCQVEYSVGVELFSPYLKESKDRRTHNEYIHQDLTKIDFEPKSFDGVILIDVLEHLTKGDGYMLLGKMEKVARKKIVISCPNGFLAQSSIDNNIGQEHKSDWKVDELRELGYRVKGMSGWKILRSSTNVCKSMAEEGRIYSTIRFKPRPFWLIISELTQIITYYFPQISFEIFCVKDL